mgnify:CR=1 FL=1
MNPQIVRPRARGFTLIELMVGVTIVLVLGALVFSMARKGIAKANGARDATTMRNTFTTILQYASDNNGLLPGPVNTGVKSVYGPQSTGRLSYYLAPVLGYENLERDDWVEPMSYSWQKDENSRNAPCAYLRKEVPLRSGTGTIMPFGHPQQRGENRQPKRLASVVTQIDPARTWIMSDLDQKHPELGNPAWKSQIPAEMSHGNYRIAVFFDGHAGKLDVDNELR